MKDLPELNQPKNLFGKVSSLFIDRFKVVYLIIFTLLFMGVYTYDILPKESKPDVSLNMVVIQTVYPGASVTDVENLITEEIEDKVNGLDGVTEVESTTESGLSKVMVTFEDDYDMDDAEQEINNEISSMSLPDDAYDPYVGVIETGEIPVLKVTLTGEYDLVALKEFGEDLQSHMENVKGIREVDLSGGYEREIQVMVDFNRLREYGMDVATLKNILQASNINIPAGDAAIDEEMLNVRLDESFSSVEEIENLILFSSGDSTVFLRDVAQVKDGYKTPDEYSQVYIRGESENEESTPAVYITVYRDSGFDIIKPCEELRGIIEGAPGDIFPSDVKTIITSDQSQDVTEDLWTVINNALGGLITVVIVLFIFIGLNESLIVSTVIPLSLLMSFLMMKQWGITFNSISLTGFIIALGLLVDNAIVVMENVDRLREEGVDRVTASKVGSNQVGPAIFAATLTTIGAFLPVVYVPGIMGKFMSVMPKTVIFIIVSSLIVSVVVTPTLCSRFLSKYKEEGEKKSRFSPKTGRIISGAFIFGLSLLAFANEWRITPMTVMASVAFTGIYAAKVHLAEKAKKTGKAGFTQRYKEFIYGTLVNGKRKAIIIVIAVVTFVAAIATIPMGMLRFELFPEEEPSAIDISIEAPVGTMLEDTKEIALGAEKIVLKYEDVESFTVNVGDGGDYKAVISAELVPEDERAMRGAQMITSIREEVKSIPGAQFTVDVKDSMSKMRSGAPVSIGLNGDDMEQLSGMAQKYLDELVKIDGVVEPRITTEGGLMEMNIDIDNNRAALYGLNISSLASEIRTQISGTKAGAYKNGNSEYDISIYYADGKIESIRDFDKIFFTANDGSLVNFHDVATIEYEQGLGKIDREDGERVVYVEADVQPGMNSNIINKQFNKATEDIRLPEDVTKVIGGDAKDLNEQMSNMAFSFMIALLLVYIVLVIQFNSMLQPIVILLSVPFAIIGVIFGLIATGNNLGFYAMFGVVALVGIAVNDAIVLIDYTNYLRSEGMDRRLAVAEAVRTRFQPVLATSLTTIGGVLPLALYNDTFSQLGFALIFGLVASTVLTLLIIPIMYYNFDSVGEKLSIKTGLFK